MRPYFAKIGGGLAFHVFYLHLLIPYPILHAMPLLQNFDDLTLQLCRSSQRVSLAVVCGSDESTSRAAMKAVADGFARVVFVGHEEKIRELPWVASAPAEHVDFLSADDDADAARKGVELVRGGRCGVLVKGLLHTASLLRAVLNKEGGLLAPHGVLTHVAVAEIPGRRKLLAFTDAAVIPYPTQVQRMVQVEVLARVIRSLGQNEPRISLLHCAETVSDKFPHTLGYDEIKQAAAQGRWGKLRVDGPLDLRTSLDAAALKVKGIQSCLEGDADGLVLPDLESGNLLYKALPLFCGAREAGILQGTTAPVVLPSRGDSPEDKFLSIALAVKSL
ncbi:MAG: phosphate acyltransferase [Alloprevotella sp.]